MVDDVLLNKVAIIERCLARIQDEYAGDERNLRENLTRQDSIILNLQRACEAVIDLAMALVKDRRLGPPQESRHAFELLRDAGLIDGDLAAPHGRNGRISECRGARLPPSESGRGQCHRDEAAGRFP